jgi:hypothetical protein
VSAAAPETAIAAVGAMLIRPLVLLLALVLPASLPAVPPSGSHIDPYPSAPGHRQLDNAAQRARYVDAYAACVARSHRRLAERMLQEPYLSEQQNRLAVDISDAGCLGPGVAQLRYRPAQLVGRVAQFFIQENYADADVARFAGLSDEAAGQLDLNPRNNAEDMASCILRRDPRRRRSGRCSPTWPPAPRPAKPSSSTMPRSGCCLPPASIAPFRSRPRRRHRRDRGWRQGIEAAYQIAS